MRAGQIGQDSVWKEEKAMDRSVRSCSFYGVVRRGVTG